MKPVYRGAIQALDKVIKLFTEADPDNKKKELLKIKNQVIMYKNYYEELAKYDEEHPINEANWKNLIIPDENN